MTHAKSTVLCKGTKVTKAAYRKGSKVTQEHDFPHKLRIPQVPQRSSTIVGNKNPITKILGCTQLHQVTL